MSKSEKKCASCDAVITSDDTSCPDCGFLLSAKPRVFKKASNATPEKVIVYVEPPVAFASGLPEWSIEPPTIVVRRKARR